MEANMQEQSQQKRPNRGSNPSVYSRHRHGKGKLIYFRHRNRRVREALRGVV